MCGDIILKTNSKSFRQKIITPPHPQTYVVGFVSFSFVLEGSRGQRVPAAVTTGPSSILKGSCVD